MTTEKRIHGKAQLDPAAYSYVRSGDNQLPQYVPGDDPRLFREAFEQARLNWERDRALVGGASTSKCRHCGAAIRYYSIFRHLPTGEHIIVGSTCEERLELDSRAALDARLLRSAAAHRAEQLRISRFAFRWQAAHPELWAEIELFRGDDFVDSLRRAVWQYGQLTERQQDALEAKLPRLREWTAPGASCELRLPEPGVEAPEGRVDIEGEIISVKRHEDDWGEREVWTVKDDRGFKVWGTVPASAFVGEPLQGRRVRFTATLTRSDRDASFAFTKRPTKAQLL